MQSDQLNVVQSSALWSAYGDALGFITELSDIKTLEWRIKDTEVRTTIPWKRKIGGQYGVEVKLPAGCYSDDTQLRLSTSRAISGDGAFDVEAFAKVELPVWTNYALGGGKGTKAAANNLVNQNVNWFSNFFQNRDGKYIDGGGNGAAMRIQPHVWVAKNKSNLDLILRDVIRNSICTHGHPRAIAGAVFHALCLNYSIQTKKYANPDYWKEIIGHIKNIPNVIRSDEPLKLFWAPFWEGKTSSKLDKAFNDVGNEFISDINLFEDLIKKDLATPYSKLLKALDATSPNTRGSGSKTALISSIIAWLYRDQDPNDLMFVIANTLESDTDTIATMVGAIVGAITKEKPRGIVQDSEYILKEADRLYDISLGASRESFSYPDLLNWKPPKNQLDAIGGLNGKLYLSGLGSLKEEEQQKYKLKGKQASFLQWFKLDYGQKILGKYREKIQPLSMARSAENEKFTENFPKTVVRSKFKDTSMPRMNDMFGETYSVTHEIFSLDALTSEAIKSGFNPEIIGRHLLKISEFEDGIEKGIAYSSIIMKAIMARNFVKKKNNK